MTSQRMRLGFHRLGLFWLGGFAVLAVLAIVEDIRIWSNARSAEMARIEQLPRTADNPRYIFLDSRYQWWHPRSDLFEVLFFVGTAGVIGYAALASLGWALSGFFPREEDRTQKNPPAP